ncbi:MAG: FkbM family methyltransferase [Streptosporangiaceae bacterium]
MTKVDPVLLQLAAELVRPGDVVWDVGANLGLFSLAAAVAAGPQGHVLALEPDVLLATMLCRSVSANPGHAPVDVLPLAAAGDLGLARFHIARRNRSTSHLDGFGTNQTGGVRATRLVPTVTLNWLAERFPRPNLIKIDVEAAEVGVLAGAGDVLRTPPRIICEVASENARAVRDLLVPHGYAFYDGEEPSGTRLPEDFPPPNTVAIPRDS